MSDYEMLMIVIGIQTLVVMLLIELFRTRK